MSSAPFTLPIGALAPDFRLPATDGRTYALADAEARLAAVSKWLRVYGASLRQIRRNLVDSVKRSTTCQSSDCRPPPRRVELEYAP